MAKKRKTASVRLRTRVGEKEYTTENAGVIITSDYAGSYSLILEFDTDEKDEKGYPVREKVKGLVTESGRKVRLIDEAGGLVGFLNVTVWDEMEAKPPRQD
jgi:hypothetical protein